MRDGLRFILGMLCAFFAVVVGLLALVGIVGELVGGQPHGPSPLLLGLMMLPLAVAAGWAAWRLF
jgi:hypothetical protein